MRDFGPEEALALMRGQNEPARARRALAGPIGDPTDVPGAYRVDHDDLGRPDDERVWQSRGSQLAALALGARHERTDPRRLRRAGSQDDDAPRGCHRGRDQPGTRTRAHRERRADSASTNVRVVNADVREPRRTGVRPCARRCPLLGPRRARAATRPALAQRGRCPSFSLSCCWRRPDAPGPAGSSSTRSARSTPTRTRRWSTRRVSSPSRSASSGPASPTRRDPSSCSTTPHRHGTSGFFIARLRV